MISRKAFLVLGRAGLDLYPEPVGTKIEDAVSFKAALGGSSGNIAAGLARLECGVSLLSRVSDDAVGQYTLAECGRYGIKTDYVTLEKSEARTTLALSESRLENCQTVIYRNNAADFSMTEDDVERVDWSSFAALIFTGTSLACEPSRRATFAAINAARAADVTVIMDVDYRAYSWASLDEAKEICGRAADLTDILVGNDDEFDVLAGTSRGSGRTHAEALAANERGPEVVVYKMGAEGSVTYHEGRPINTGIFHVDALKPTGAGDAFMASLAHSLSNDFSLHDAVLRGSAAAAIVVTRVGCAPAMPTSLELRDFMTQHTTTA